MSETIINIPHGKIPYLIPGECYPKLEVYSIDAEGNPNKLFLIPPVDYPITLNQSNHYRFILINEGIDDDWKYAYKIGIKENGTYDILSEIEDNGHGQKSYRQDIIFR